MIVSVRLARIVLSVLLLILLVFMACQRPGSSPVGDNANVQITLQPLPLEETLVIVLTDAAGTPVTDATVALEGNMSHPGMIPVLADPIADDADGSADGRYHLPFTFTMLGDWIITVTVTQADGSSFTRDLDVRARQDGIEGDTVLPMENATPTPSASGEPDAEAVGDTSTHANHEQSDHEDATGAHAAVMHIHGPMARPAPLAGGTGAVYFLLHNGGEVPVKLIGADSPAASAAEFHTTTNDNGVMRMRQITGGVEIGVDESIELTPGAMHLMLVALTAPLAEGDTIEVTLHFEGTDDLTFDAPVVGLDDLPNEGEASHDH